jgi:hypothetical protein
MRLPLLFLVTLLLATTVSAAGLSPISPKTNSTSSTSAQFFFTTSSGAMIESCQLFVDGKLMRTAVYKDVLRNRQLSYKETLEEGPHTWHVVCLSDEGELSTDVQQFTALTPENAAVTISASGAFRGSFDHTFKFTNSPTQKPVTVDKLAPGDFIIIEFTVAPSTTTKQLYVKQMSKLDDKIYLWLEDAKKGENYRVFLGENATINISTTHVILEFSNVVQNKAIVIVHPRPGLALPPQANAPSTPAANVSERINTSIVRNETVPNKTTPMAPAVNRTDNRTTPATPEPPRQGGFKRFLSWLSRLFG